MAGFSHWIFNGAGHEWHLRLPRITVFYLPITSYRYGFLHEQWHQFGTGAWALLHTHDLIALSTGISTKQEKASETFFQIPGIQGIGISDGVVKVKAVHVKRGGRHMKTGTYFLLAILVLLGLLLGAGPASAWSDTTVHYATSSNCTAHVNTPIHSFSGASWTFNLCRADSQATLWRVQMLDYLNRTITTCTNIIPPSQLKTVSTPITFTCPGLILNQVTKAKVFWKVGTSPEMQHTDTFKRIF